MAASVSREKGEKSIEFCKFFLEGKCLKGEQCRYRHHGQERPTATAFAREVLTLVVERQSSVQRLIPDGVPSSSYTIVLPSGIKATFADGVMPSHILFLDELRPKIKMIFVRTGLEVNCYQPLHLIWMECKDITHAQAVHASLHGKQLHGVKLACNMQSTATKRWTVEITNATESIDSEHVMAMLPLGVRKPFEVRSGPPSYDPTTNVTEVMQSVIASKTNRTVTDSAMSEFANKTKYKVFFEVEGNPNLSLIARTLNEERVPELGNSQIYAQERTEAVLTIDRQAFKKQTCGLKKLSSTQRKFNSVVIHYDETTPETKPVEVTIRGSDRKAVLQAKAEIDKIFIKDMAAFLDGRQPMPQQPPKRYRIDLEAKDCFKVADGLAKLKGVLGRKKVVYLDRKSNPPALVVRGDIHTMAKVHEIMFPGRDDPKYSNACLICFDPAEDAITMPGCDHVACKDCFTQYCTIERQAKFPLRCFSTECDKVATLRHLRETLDVDDLNLLLQQSLADHFVSHPQDYAQCPGFECAAYYKVDSSTDKHGELTCPTCFTVICADCKVEQHFGENCEVYQERTSGALQLREAIEKAGAKRCKGCATIIEKIEGCNNMNCPGCQAHFCWKCMEIFPTHPAVYEHLTAEHGGWFDEGQGVQLLQDDGLELEEAVARREVQAFLVQAQLRNAGLREAQARRIRAEAAREDLAAIRRGEGRLPPPRRHPLANGPQPGGDVEW